MLAAKNNSEEWQQQQQQQQQQQLRLGAKMSITTIRAELAESAIDPSFIGGAIKIAPALESDPITKEATETPLDDALGRKFVQFPHNIEPGNEWGIIFRNEDETTWQVKRHFGLPPRPNQKRSGNYFAPKGIGNAIFLPPIPLPILAKICARHGIKLIEAFAEIKDCEGFWAWVVERKDLRRIVTEGGKKSLAALSAGHIAIGLYGCKCGRSEQLKPFLEDAPVVVAFDRDEKASARKAVTHGIFMLAGAVGAAAGNLSVASWPYAAGKGADDLIFNQGAKAFEEAIETATPFELWAARQSVAAPLGRYTPDMEVCTPELGAQVALASVPSSGTIVIHSKTATGKTKLIGRLISGAEGAISPGHRISLQRGLSHRLGLNYLADADRARGYLIGEDGNVTRRIGLCWDSVLGIPLWLFPDGTYELVLDEVEQGLEHLLAGSTCGKDGRRPGLASRAIDLIKGARRVVLASATLSWREIDLVAGLRGEKPWILSNNYRGKAYPVELFSGKRGVKGSCGQARGAVLARLQQAIQAGKRIIVACDQLRASKAIASLAEKWGLSPEQILRFDGETSSEDEQRAFAENPDLYLRKRRDAGREIRLLLHSPSLVSGSSIEEKWFDLSFGFFEGQTISPADVLQALARYRKPVQRIIYASHYGRGDAANASNANDYQLQSDYTAKMIAAATGRTITTWDADDPLSIYHAATQANRNASMIHFAVSLQAILEREGHLVSLGTCEEGATSKAWQRAQDAVAARDRRALLNAPIISEEEAGKLQEQHTIKHVDALKLGRFKLCDFYKISPDQLRMKDIEADRKGKGRLAIARLESLLWEGLARERDSSKLKSLQHWEQPIAPHDLPHAELFSEAAIKLQIPDLLQQCLESKNGWNAKTEWICEFAARMRQYTKDVALALGFSIHESMKDCAIVGMTLKHFGLATQSTRETIDGKRIRRYFLEAPALERAKEILLRRAERHEQKGFRARPHPLIDHLLGGVADPAADLDLVAGYARRLQSAIEKGADFVQNTWREICGQVSLAIRSTIRAATPYMEGLPCS